VLKKPHKAHLALALVAGLLPAWGLAGEPPQADPAPRVEVKAYSQVWFVPWEQYEDAHGQIQHPSGDEAADVSSGFRLNTARVGARVTDPSGALSLNTLIRLEKNLGLLDAYGAWRVGDWLTLRLGQFKMPNSGEALVPTEKQDFVTRSRLSQALSDYSLSRTTYASSLFYGVRSSDRDLGLGVLGEARLGPVPLRWFGMVGNGLGAGLYVGASSKEFILTNRFGQFLYAGRLEVEPRPGWLTLGGHAAYNRHDDLLFNSGRAVLDLNRVAWSADAAFHWKSGGLRLGGLWGGGSIREDSDGNGLTDFAYTGFSTHLLWSLGPALRQVLSHGLPEAHAITLGARFDRLAGESDESGLPVTDDTWTVGLAYQHRELLKVQLNWLIKRTDEAYAPDLDDDALVLAVQLLY
jgi:hypothetical protein